MKLEAALSWVMVLSLLSAGMVRAAEAPAPAEPQNEIGLSNDEAYVSDIKHYWTYSSLHYTRFTNNYGNYTARVNFANRLGGAAEQYQIEANPRWPGSQYFQYLHLSAAQANDNQTLFPQYQYVIEPYFNLPVGFETSLGLTALRAVSVNIYTYTATLGYYWGNYYFWLRPYHFVPKSSDYFELAARRYFSDSRSFVTLKFGIGKAPDLLDIAPLNQIVVLQQDLASLSGQFPVHKNIYAQTGIGYLKQIYPSGTVREITDINLGFIWLF